MNRTCSAWMVVLAVVLAAPVSGAQTTSRPVEVRKAREPVTYPIPNTNVSEAARILYDDVANGLDLEEPLREVFGAMGVPILAVATEEEAILALQRAGDPYALDIQISAIA